MGGDKRVAECKPPFWITGAGGVVNRSLVNRPSSVMVGVGELTNVLALVLRSAVSPLMEFRIK